MSTDTLREIIRELAERNPLAVAGFMGDERTQYMSCRWCGLAPLFAYDSPEEIEAKHRNTNSTRAALCLWLRARAALREPAPSPWREVTEQEPPEGELILILTAGAERARVGSFLGPEDGYRERWVFRNDDPLIERGDLWLPLPARPTPQQSKEPTP